ncbi:unnamed protein product [Parascedosporium putredinis]|uniref:CorA-like transporter domain-containing protein n=1 Tax=Parascedosporium putredinis TaxID=1442378 RepID=A0A9P1MCL2_9PEZI|nr:unnamed protein product [Parascedosporium putredinis]CAI7996802.1 unnamed protein product [Parascedosporium putredinis]
MSEDQLFDSESEELTFLDFYDGCERYQYNIVTTSDEINRHILNGQADPLCRHVFITANSSRGPLKCSRESLCKILSYHQTHAYFVDCISTFGATEDPLDYSLVSMYSDDTLHLAEERLLHIPRLNRSGHDIQLSYILRSVEKSEQWEKDKLEGKWQWKIRQMAVHHQFDVKTGRALWITIKANGLMEDRVKSLPWTCSQDAGGRVDAAEQFVATLRTQLIFLMWSDDNWRHCINDIEEQIRDILNKAKTARIEDDQEPKDIPMTIAKKLSRRGSKGWNGEKDEGPPTSRNWTLHWLLHSPRRKAASAATQLLQKVDKRYRTPMRATSQSEQMSSEASPLPASNFRSRRRGQTITMPIPIAMPGSFGICLSLGNSRLTNPKSSLMWESDWRK